MNWNNLDVPARHYLERFTRLPEEVQTHVNACLDAGERVVSTFDLSAGTTVCKLTPDQILWEEAATRTELVDLALDAQSVMSHLNGEKQQAVEEAIANGARLLVALCHTTGGEEIYLHRDGMEPHLLGKLDVPKEVTH